MINAYINDLANITKEKRYRLKNIQDITKVQKTDIIASDEKSLLYNIEKKQKEIDEINELDKKFYEILCEVKEKLNINSMEEIDCNKYPMAKILKDEVAKIMETLKMMSEDEKENNKKLEIEINNIKKEMKNFQQNKKAYSVYNKYNHAQGVFVDRMK